MKYYVALPLLLLTSCATTNYDPFLDEKIVNNQVCQSSLKTLVENDAFLEVKTLIDRECNNLVVRGWVKGKIDNAFDKRCKASFQYLVQRPALQEWLNNLLKMNVILKTLISFIGNQQKM